MSSPANDRAETPDPTGGRPPQRQQPSLTVGMVLLVLAGVLIVVVLVQPTMAPWLKIVIAVLAVLTVIALLAFSVMLVRSTKQAGRGR